MRKLLPVAIIILLSAVGWVFWPRPHQALILYSAVGYGNEVAAAFTRKTGIPVTVISSSTGSLIARISAEAEHPQWALAWFDGATTASGLDAAGLLAHHVAPKTGWTIEGQRLLPVDGAYVPTGFTLSGVYAFRRGGGLLPPAHWRGLLATAYRGAVGMNNPAISGPTFPLLAGLLKTGGGWPRGQAYLLGLKSNNLHVYRTNSTTLDALESGEIKLAVVQSSAAFFLAQKPGSDIIVHVPAPAFLLPRVLVVAPGLSSSAARAATAFIHFALSPEAQRQAMRPGDPDGLYWPVTSNAPAPNKILPRASSLNLIVIDPSFWGPLEGRINQWFSRKMVGQ